MKELVQEVRKHGSVVLPTRTEALRLIRAAAKSGHQFAQVARFDGFLVTDEEA